MRVRSLAGSTMSSVPVNANETRQHETSRPGDAVVVRGIAAFLVLLALVALLVVPGAARFVVAATILASGVGLFAAASWRRTPA